MYCEKCGVENKKDARFCKSCGNPLQNRNVEVQEQKEGSGRKKGSMKWKILSIIILLIAIAAGICLAKKVVKEKKHKIIRIPLFRQTSIWRLWIMNRQKNIT